MAEFSFPTIAVGTIVLYKSKTRYSKKSSVPSRAIGHEVIQKTLANVPRPLFQNQSNMKFVIKKTLLAM